MSEIKGSEWDCQLTAVSIQGWKAKEYKPRLTDIKLESALLMKAMVRH